VTSDLAARVTTGAEWPDGAPGGRPAGVLLLSAEDGASDTIVPRLKAADADMDRIYLLNEVMDDDGEMVMPSVPKHIPQIEQIVKENRVGLVVVDVLMAYLEGDSYRDQAVRKMLTPLARMAARTGACIVLIRHLKKSGKKGSAIMNGSGSIGIIGAARASFLVAVDEHDHERRLFATVKMNIAKEPPTLAYRLVDDGTLGVARCDWEPDAVDISAEDLGVKNPDGRTAVRTR
jgi:RecA-family ATPase